MARRLDYSARYPLHTTAELYEALSSRDYWEARVEKMRELTPGNEVVSLDVDESGIRVELRHILPREMLPEIAQTVMRKDMVITRKESWGPFDAAESVGKYSASIPAGPGSLGGTIKLFPTETGCTMRFSSEAKVYIPMVGPRLEQLMLVNLVDLFRGEAEETVRWLDERKPAG
ncbi:DUF2505 domain-containing protein [Nocardia farcinica]|uniref:DUF2505 domain-containing protein n=2 Tax=Nocardia farcinica TaxID=37329 RepID=Q5YP40_NOCFA|nr:MULTISPECIES: DUF2505 domain-containing protein [Nocardia]SLH17333.1 Protein of uncharacterised function (DUF2505) [Mycobacteroides abscessus subsp. abscessus]AXK87545.1 DUF2505 domain-containing protein [Nocardia farcinica]MBA4857423.1 DUF2505 domain-containing protein [Nocardia farcinica]MBC9816875.1 DUF2505 domain-containing protein [Nocardia farcinica]MBF6071103.1 DUF2505 domain-containing protein [Nocardia farcinica]